MISFLIFVVVWVAGAWILHVERKLFAKKNPTVWTNRGSGLITFSDRQTWWMMTLWPLAILALIGYVTMLLVCLDIEQYLEWKERRACRKSSDTK